MGVGTSLERIAMTRGLHRVWREDERVIVMINVFLILLLD